jgi:hypothetical protein
MPLLQLTAHEARVLGSLIEKSQTTPDLYPLSLNSLMNACNQKTSRDPVMTIDEATVARTLASLREKNLVSNRSEPGSRITKFAHRAENLLGGGTSKEFGILCVLLLRGPQTPGEIRVRTDRLCEFANVPELEMILQELGNRPDGAVVVRLPRQPGQKEARYQHLFSGAPIISEPTPPVAYAAASSVMPSAPAPSVSPQPMRQLADLLGARLQALEQRIAYLESRLGNLENRF